MEKVSAVKTFRMIVDFQGRRCWEVTTGMRRHVTKTCDHVKFSHLIQVALKTSASSSPMVESSMVRPRSDRLAINRSTKKNLFLLRDCRKLNHCLPHGKTRRNRERTTLPLV